MKTWKMPQVAVEAFRANEYVASCIDVLQTNERAIRNLSYGGSWETVYLDLNGDSDGNWATSVYTSGSLITKENLDNWNVTGQTVYFQISSTDDSSKRRQATDLGLDVIEVGGVLNPVGWPSKWITEPELWVSCYGYHNESSVGNGAWYLASNQSIVHNQS